MKKALFYLFAFAVIGFTVLACEPYVPDPPKPDTLHISDVKLEPGDNSVWPDWYNEEFTANHQDCIKGFHIWFNTDSANQWVWVNIMMYDSLDWVLAADESGTIIQTFSPLLFISRTPGDFHNTRDKRVYPDYPFTYLANFTDTFLNGYYYAEVYDSTGTILLGTSDTTLYFASYYNHQSDFHP